MGKHRQPRRRYYLWQIKYRLQSEWAGLKLTIADIKQEVQDILIELKNK